MNTEFGGAELPTESEGPTESSEPEKSQEHTELEASEEPDGGGAEPPEPDMTEHMSRRINKIREEAEERVRQAEERARQAAFKPAKGNESIEFLQVQGSINPYTGNVIDNLGEYKAYKKMFDEESEQFDQSEPENILELVEEKVSKILTAKEVETNAKNMLKADLAKISRTNPSIKTIADIEKLPESKTILEKVMRGYDLHDAYFTSVQTKSVKPKEDTTGHMVSVTGNGGGQGLKPIPTNEVSFYENAWPDLTAKERTEKYNTILQLQGE